MAIKRNRKPGKLILLVLGWGFVALGILGLFLPVLQGILFLAVGMILLAQVSPRARLLRQRLRRRYPQAAGVFDKAEKKAAQWIARVARLFRRNATRP
ncbi:MAG: PGPGW domain-containing protein [Alphaproteobacteria bacterium]